MKNIMYAIQNKSNPKLKWSGVKKEYVECMPYYLVFDKNKAEEKAKEVEGVVILQEVNISSPLIHLNKIF